MKEMFQLPDSLPEFYASDASRRVLAEFDDGDVLYVIGAVDVSVVRGEIEVFGFAVTADAPTKTALYSYGPSGLISIASTGGGRKALVSLEESGPPASGRKAFVDEYVPGEWYPRFRDARKRAFPKKTEKNVVSTRGRFVSRRFGGRCRHEVDAAGSRARAGGPPRLPVRPEPDADVAPKADVRRAVERILRRPPRAPRRP